MRSPEAVSVPASPILRARPARALALDTGRLRPVHLALATAALCAGPLLLSLAGVDFSSQSPFGAEELEAFRWGPGAVDTMHSILIGSHVHTLLEWSAFCSAIFIAFLGSVHFRIAGNPVIPIVGMALFWAGCMDAFHTLAADRLVSAVADNRNLIPFTWAICRSFNALILLTGIGALLLRDPSKTRSQSLFVFGASSVFGLVAFAIIYLAASSHNLPQTMYPDAFVRRPWDVFPLVIYLFIGVGVMPRFHAKHPGHFSLALWISIIPHVATQLYMAFGSRQLFDADFNIAHALKILAYIIPIFGLGLDYIETYRKADRTDYLEEEIERRVRIEAELQHQVQQEMIQTSRRAGMAEVATGILHNIGNVLNSLNVSLSVGTERTAALDLDALRKTNELVQENRGDLGAFLSTDPRGRIVPTFLDKLSAKLLDDREVVIQELESASKFVNHIKEIVSTQQRYTHLSGLIEKISLAELVDDGLRMSMGSPKNQGFSIARYFPADTTLDVDKQKLLQILVNLFSNARHALRDSTTADKVLTLRLRRSADDRMILDVHDNGIGIPPEDLTRIFSFGHTTKKDGHGFGLHASALAASELGGSLNAHSEGPGKGATFTLVVPCEPPEPSVD